MIIHESSFITYKNTETDREIYKINVKENTILNFVIQNTHCSVYEAKFVY